MWEEGKGCGLRAGWDGLLAFACLSHARFWQLYELPWSSCLFALPVFRKV